MLFPEDNDDVNLQQLDPALIFWFLRHICHFKKQNDLVWKWKPAHNDHSTAADLVRIRDLRNGLINATERAMLDDEYERKIEEFKKVCYLYDVFYRVLLLNFTCFDIKC